MKDLLSIHWKVLLESGAMTKDVSSCLQHRVNDIIQEYQKRKIPLPDIPNNEDLTVVQQYNQQAEDMKHIIHGRWPKLNNFVVSNFC